MLQEIKDNNIQEILNTDKPVMVDFYASWCGPCKMAMPVVEYIANSYEEEFVVAKLNVEENEELAKQYNVLKIPTFIFFKNGEQKDIMTGGDLRRSKMIEKLNALK